MYRPIIVCMDVRANKLEVIHDNGSVKIGLIKNTRREINDILRIQDCRWVWGCAIDQASIPFTSLLIEMLRG